MTARELVELLEGRGARVRRTRDGDYQAQCPAHDDRTPSLHVTDRDDKVLVHCHAGCDTEAVLDAAGLDLQALFHDSRNGHAKEIVAAYDYTDADGRLRFQQVRYFPKDFRSRRPDGAGDWVWNLQGVERVLYRLPRIREGIERGERTFIAEGERDVDALERRGLYATCNPGGAGKWRDDYSRALDGATAVSVIRDRDDAGRAHADEVVASLKRVLGVTPLLLEPAAGKDVSDHLAAGKTLRDLAVVSDDAATPKAQTVEDDDQAQVAGVPTYPADAFPFSFADAKLPPALVYGAALAAAACAVGGRAQLRVGLAWHARPILWIPLVAPRGAGKSPAQALAFAPLRDFDRDLDDDGIPLRAGDLTMEALARTLGQQPALAIDVDELAQPLRGIGEYKRASGDRGRLLALWQGDPWRFTRVGDSKKKTNSVDIRVAAPTVVICGALQTHLHGLLGGEEDGLRPRWLPHLAKLPRSVEDIDDVAVRNGAWDGRIRELVEQRERDRAWTLSDEARAVFNEYRRRWKTAAHGDETASTSAALVKADVHLARVALVLAELDTPGSGGAINADTVERAACIVDFTLDCWRALPEQSSFALSYRAEKLNEGIVRLGAWLEEHGEANRRRLLRSHVAGVQCAQDLDELLRRYEQVNPGRIVTEEPERGGTPTTFVYPPLRGERAI